MAGGDSSARSYGRRTALTLKGQVQVFVLVSGDSDFVPAMKFARREGAQVFLVTLGHGIKESMREHADLVIDSFPLTGTVDCAKIASAGSAHV